MSFSNNFVVKFVNSPFPAPNAEGAEYFSLFCNEAQLPNVNTAQGTVNGIYNGIGQVSYPHTRVFTEFQLGFMCDANLTALKYMQDWVDFIFSGESNEMGDSRVANTLEQMQALTFTKTENRNVRLKYRDDYACTLAITKTEQGSSSTTERAPITYVLEHAYPYAIDAVPLQYGSSQITQVTVQFSYQRHYTIKNDVTTVGVVPPAPILPTALVLPPPS